MIAAALLLLQSSVLPGTGVVSGVVTDTYRGTPLAGAVVILADIGVVTVTDSTGYFRLDAAPGGFQHLDVRCAGYAERALHILVPAGGRIRIDVGLEPRPLPVQGLRVTPGINSSAVVPRSEGAFPVLEASRQAIRDNPLSAEPDAVRVLLGGSTTAMPEIPSGMHVRGGGSDEVGYMLDGIPVLSPFHAAGLFSAWNPQALGSVELWTGSRPLWAPDALSGLVLGRTVRPPGRFMAQGVASTDQIGLTLGIPSGNGGLVAGVRHAFPGTVGPDPDGSFLHGAASDEIGAFEGRFGEGALKVVFFRNRNVLRSAAFSASDSLVVAGSQPLNRFGWGGASVGIEWSQPVGHATGFTTRLWRASADASVAWADRWTMRSERVDMGGVAMLTRAFASADMIGGVEFRRSTTAYRTRSEEDGRTLWELRGTLRAVALFLGATRAWSSSWSSEAGVRATLMNETSVLSAQTSVSWARPGLVSVSLGVSRPLQLHQSLRNDQSLFSMVLPSELYVTAGSGGVPVARAREVSLSSVLTPAPGVTVLGQAYRRRSSDLVLSASGSALPFALDGFTVGSSTSTGFEIRATRSFSRYSLSVTYGFQRTRYTYGDTTYQPDFAAGHSLVVGVAAHPWQTVSVRAGMVELLGRRTTAVVGPVDWQACTLDNRGCQVAGSPSRRAEPLGATSLPSYARVDLSLRKHWDVHVAGRPSVVAVYGSLSNLLGRRNLLTVAESPVSGVREALEMRARSPLVVGLEWRF